MPPTRMGSTATSTTTRRSNFTDGFYARPKGMRYPGGVKLAYLNDFNGYLTHEQDPVSGLVYRQTTVRNARRHRVANWLMNRMRPGSAGNAGGNHCPAPPPGNQIHSNLCQFGTGFVTKNDACPTKNGKSGVIRCRRCECSLESEPMNGEALSRIYD